MGHRKDWGVDAVGSDFLRGWSHHKPNAIFFSESFNWMKVHIVGCEFKGWWDSEK